ncbi:hypothetical protein C5167_016228 [Papaver somniferum]|uniref:uncharacterized protein LOC113333375 n=1 Tax=Papaver somniferum TaxID=3469 RepID=UPI000E6F7B1C|nr:uncharacterized protein LOC113333375 [Papaver somniferum]RZC88418.1 hypothetical protein C5167_016228 [Papaver somniferum]
MGWKAAQKLVQNWKGLRGDNVMIIRGKDKGETGVVKRVVRTQNRVIVEGKNLVKKHIKQGQGHEGGIFTVEAPLHVSNVQVVDPVTGKPCKVGVKYLEDGTKVRVSRGIGASGSIIPRPEILKIRTTPRPTIAGAKDTPMEQVLEKTYDAKTGRGMPSL